MVIARRRKWVNNWGFNPRDQTTCTSSGGSPTTSAGTYNCDIDGICTDPGDGSGFFSGATAYNDCLSVCSCYMTGCATLSSWLSNPRGAYSIGVSNYTQYDTVMSGGKCYHCIEPFDAS